MMQARRSGALVGVFLFVSAPQVFSDPTYRTMGRPAPFTVNDPPLAVVPDPEPPDPLTPPGVCEPQTVTSFVTPTPEKTKYAAFYFPWHANAPECAGDPDHPNPWCRCIFSQKTGGPRPQAGYYGSNATPDNAAVVANHMQQLKDHGVSVVGVAMDGGAGDPGQHRKSAASGDYRSEHAVRNSIRPRSPISST